MVFGTLPIALVLLPSLALDLVIPVLSYPASVVIMDGSYLLAGLLHLYFGWRLMYISSLTRNSDRIAKGEHVVSGDEHGLKAAWTNSGRRCCGS
jgi:hypothetical protein